MFSVTTDLKDSKSLLISQPPSANSMHLTRPLKRRKLASPLTVAVSSPKEALTKPITISTPATTTHVKPSCISCHRSLNAAHSQGMLVICARCASPTCAICSRTCTACPSSMPPTPYLTRSPTPTPPSPRRAALSINSVNTNNALNINRGEKRRKDIEEEADEGFVQYMVEEDVAPGCGRTVCRGCCTENKEIAWVACHDCMGRY